jgi:hypothetical protein
MKTDPQAQTLINKLADFFWVYYDQKTSAMIKKHPERAIPLIREVIKDGTLSKSKLIIYAGAMQDAAAYQSLLLKM